MMYPAKTVAKLAVAASLAFFASACVSTGVKTNTTSSGGPSMNEARMEAYNGPKARIAVARFEDKTGAGARWWNPQIGDGMADQLVTALFQSNRFIVLERGEGIQDVMAEQDLGASGRVRGGTEARIGELEGAELLVVAAVTELSGNSGGTSGGVRTSNRALNAIGSLVGGARKAHIAIDLRIVDANTGRILSATSVEGESTDWNVGGALAEYGGAVSLGGSLSMWKNTPMEKALRQVIGAAVQEVVNRTPQRFYRHGGSQPAGNMASSSAPMTSDEPSRGRLEITASSLNVRGGPGTNHGVVFSLQQGDRVDLIGSANGWVKIRDDAQRVGWVSEQFTASL